ncbi:MAG: Fe-S protein assembly chaperone HscA [Sedimenticolaceae bacterium]
MALLQIAEPGQSAAPHLHRLAAGIDLGTTNSLVATVRSGLAETLPDEQGRHILPSVVRYCATGVEVGEAARRAAAADPLNTISSAKRLIGRGIADVKSLGRELPYEFVMADSPVPRIRTIAGDVTPIEVSAEILKVLAQRAQEILGGELSGVVITVPAYFDDAQRQATRDAARLAGLHVFRLLNEPTAAAVAYGLDHAADGVHAIYDLGGGTFDISVLRLHKGVFEVMATGGDSALGGDDFDAAVAGWLLTEADLGSDADRGTLRHLLDQARAAKERLAQQETVALEIDRPDAGLWRGILTRKQLADLLDPLIRKTINTCRRVLRDAGVTIDEIEDIVMVGGSTRTLRVREKVSEYFGQAPLVDIDPDRVVAIGAAIQADVLAGNRPDDEMLLLDVNPLSLGIETMGGLTEKILPRNTALPAARAQEFTTFKDGQTAMSIHVVQGERELVADCRSLARFTLRDIPPMVAGAARIRVTYSVDADGLLRVEASELSSGALARVEVKPSYGLTDDEITGMLKASIEHARDDIDARRLVEEQVEAQRVTQALNAALACDADELLSAQERAVIDQALQALNATVDVSQDAAEVEAAVKRLESDCEFYVERRMNSGVRKALAGQRVDEIAQRHGREAD